MKHYLLPAASEVIPESHRDVLFFRLQQSFRVVLKYSSNRSNRTFLIKSLAARLKLQLREIHLSGFYLFTDILLISINKKFTQPSLLKAVFLVTRENVLEQLICLPT